MVLERVNSPADLKNLTIEELRTLAEEIRQYILTVMSTTPGHLASNLGTVELTIALHRVFDAPSDKIVWDVGHQAYAHKIITGRRDLFPTIRKYGGLSGFLKREESEYDAFGAGHAGTSIPAALGMAVGRDLKGEGFRVIVVIGDGAMGTGMAFEGLNNAGGMRRNLIVILNDNKMSISPNVGALAKYINRIVTNRAYTLFRENTEEIIRRTSPGAARLARRLTALMGEGTLFQELGFQYFGPVDGHDIEEMIEVFEGIKHMHGPILVHVVTKKGKGYEFAERNPTRFHSVSGIDLATGQPIKRESPPSYTTIFSQTLIELARQDERIVAITAAMPSGTGLDKFMEVFPDRCFDLGIAEQCAVTFAAGLASQGFKPVVAIYSTFLQRAYDQVEHDVCLQNLPVVFAMDRGGLVGEDGPTHHGVFDIAYLRHLPNIVVMAPRDENELRHMLRTALEHNGPIAMRYPRGAGVGVKLSDEIKTVPIGEAELMREGDDLLILAIGRTVHPALKAAERLKDEGINAAVVNSRFVKPLDEEMILDMSSQIGKVITVEDHVLAGGFGSAVCELLMDRGVAVRIKRLGIPDRFIEHGDLKTLHRICGIDEEGIYRAALRIVEGGGDEA
ncbi:TPA: 1-deoxy-D-xylulose-5-phosphate synthase [Candidatus Poribacteria bacterium]|nr:1-deoxy-D-xylulose-5-phosphate synthase [Candidatus Poribacteria bacterium]